MWSSIWKLPLVSRFISRLTTRTGVASTVAALLVGVAFFKLGLWQLSRADEKTGIVQMHRAATELPPLEVLPADAADANAAEKILYRRVELSGRFDTRHQFLLDNRTLGGQAGFEVITPFFLSDDSYLLVSRGWIGHNGNRQVQLMEPASNELPELLRGIVVTPSRGVLLGDSSPDPGITNWPVILQFIDYETIAAKLDKIPVMDAVIVAADGQPGNYTYNWKPIGSGAQVHLGYAFQWFAMLLALVGLYLYLMVIRQNDD